MTATSQRPRTVFFHVQQGSEDEKTAPLDPDPSGRSRVAGVAEHFAGRAERRVMVSNPDSDGLSFTIFKFAPGTLLPNHRHDVDYIEFVLEGEVHHGNRVLKAGEGVYRSAGTPYSIGPGPKAPPSPTFGRIPSTKRSTRIPPKNGRRTSCRSPIPEPEMMRP